MEAARSDANLGLYDGQVSHAQINQALALSAKVILFGEQTRLPYFPDDERLPKLHAGDPRVLLFWKVLKKIPQNLRTALLEAPLSLTLVRNHSLLYFADYRCHQALHIGCRRRTVYLPEILLQAAEEKGYDYWAIAEGIIYAGWMLLDYLLLVDVLGAYRQQVQELPGYRLGEALQLKLVTLYNRHRRDSIDAQRSEVGEFVEGYGRALLGVAPEQVLAEEPFALARALFAPALEERWARDKMERIAQVFNFPRLFLFDRDIIHGTARRLALAQGQAVEPRSFSEVLHDYRDAWRFEPRPLKTLLGRSLMPKPRAVFLEQVVGLGIKGLSGFLAAYARGEEEVQELMHPLWMYLCSLSSDPAGVFARVGRCRAIGRQGLDEDMDRHLAGILIRLDRAPNYAELVEATCRLGEAAHVELEELVAAQQLEEEDPWEVFKSPKQTIVARACQALERMQTGQAEAMAGRASLHEDELIRRLLDDSPHRLTSDPSGVLMYLRAYRRSLERFGPQDADTHFLLASVLLRLDKSEHYVYLLQQVQALGTPAFSALHNVFEQIPERDLKRREILKQARILWSRMLAQTRAFARRRKSR